MARMPDGWVCTVEADGNEVCISGSRELVMCKNCMHYEQEPEGDVMMCYCGLGWTAPDDFCSKGERRENDA